MLNALRHQRLYHSYNSVFAQTAYECSTPYGIRGCITLGQAGGSVQTVLCSTPYGIRGCITNCIFDKNMVRYKVLNALRHQRLYHLPSGSTNILQDKCSTPYGIRGCITCKSTWHNHVSIRAQRLTASEVVSQPLLESLSLQAFVYSPFMMEAK